MSKPLAQVITENTGISVGVVALLIGGVFWLSTLYAKAQNTEETVDRIEKSQEEYNKNLLQINNRLGRIEGRLKIGERY